MEVGCLTLLAYVSDNQAFVEEHLSFSPLLSSLEEALSGVSRFSSPVFQRPNQSVSTQ